MSSSFFKTRSIVATALLVLLSALSYETYASHNAGGHLTYKFLEQVNGFNRYEVTLKMIVDSQYSNSYAIQEDNPVFIAIFTADGSLMISDSIFRTSSTEIPVVTLGCKGLLAPRFKEFTFTKVYSLPANDQDFTIAFQRCCRHQTIVNIFKPGEMGITYFSTIRSSSSVPNNNSSAVFNSTPIIAACINTPITIDNGATDPDGDSISYEFSQAYTGGEITDPKPIPKAPPYIPIVYTGNLSYRSPLISTSGIQISPTTGLITATPNVAGTYVISVACNEWRDGIKINTIRKEYQVRVTTDEELQPAPGPNLVQGELVIEILSPTVNNTLIICDLTGRVVYTVELQVGRNNIDISRLPRGIYILLYHDGIMKHQKGSLKCNGKEA